MKPDWKYAPEWAKYLAQNENGDWEWFEHAPFIDDDTRWASYLKVHHRSEWASEGPWEDAREWRKSLEHRP